ncbi:MAG: carboxypeptidase-like regulatory domain-containing protein [Phycisphaerales bacterium]
MNKCSKFIFTAIAAYLLGMWSVCVLGEACKYSEKHQERTEYCGMVRDSADNPIGNVNISLVLINDLSGKNPNEDTKVLAVTRTDLKGRFKLEYKQSTDNLYIIILAEKDGYAIGWLEPRFSFILNNIIVLVKDAKLGGIVKDTDGKLISGAIVHAIPVSANDNFGDSLNEHIGIIKQFTTITDGGGRFCINKMADGQRYRFKVCANNYYDGVYIAEYEPGSDLEIIIQQVNDVFIKFRDNQGNPEAGLNFELSGDIPPDKRIYESGLTNDKGIAEFKLAPGKYEIEYNAAKETDIGFYNKSFSVVKDTNISIDVNTFQIGTLEITVLDPNTNKPMEGVHVFKNVFKGEITEILKANLEKQNILITRIGFAGTTDRNGKVRFYLPEGETGIEFLVYNQETIYTNYRYSIKPGEIIKAEIILGAEQMSSR